MVAMLQPNAKALQPAEAADGGYVCPDSHTTDDPKLEEIGMEMITPCALERRGDSDAGFWALVSICRSSHGVGWRFKALEG